MAKFLISIEVPDNATVETRWATEADSDLSAGSSEASGTNPVRESRGLRMIHENAPARDAEYQVACFDQVLARFGIEGTPPSTGSRTYLNFLPPKRYGSSKVAALETRSGRTVVACNLADADKHPGTRVAEGKYVEIYLTSDAAVETAVALVESALRERGWSGPTNEA